MNLVNIIESQDYKAILAEYVVHNTLDFAIKGFRTKIQAQEENRPKKIGKKQKSIFDIETNKKNVEDKIAVALIQAFNYTKDISFNDLDTPKLIVETFVDPIFFTAQRRTQVLNSDPVRKNMETVFKNCLVNLIILGDLGAGKTTLVKKLCQSIFLKDGTYYKQLNFPILIRLREINGYHSEINSLIFFEFILNRLGFVLREFSKDDIKEKNSYVTNLKKYICDFLEDINVLLLLDGFDEINDIQVRKILVEDIELISTSFVKSKILVTSRTAEFNYDISNTQTYEIAPLDNSQIDIFINHYIKDLAEATKFKKELLASPYFDTSRKPLALAHLCAIYERYHNLPPKPKSVYKKIVGLYIEEWDSQRRIDRVKKGITASEYNNLSNDRKFEFLTKFAYLLTTEFGSTTIFTENDITKCYNSLFEEFDLPAKQSKLIVKEIEGHSGLILQSSNETFEFSHKSIHEYLTAEYVSRMGTLPRKQGLLVQIPNELAIATSLSSEPNAFMFRLFVKYLKTNAHNIQFINAFLSRLYLEKPDFRIEPILGFTLAYIYSILKFGNVNSIKNKTNFLFADDLLTTNELLLKLIRTNVNIKKSIEEFLVFYRVNFNYTLTVSDSKDYTITRLHKLNNIPNYNKTDQPEYLVVPAFFL